MKLRLHPSRPLQLDCRYCIDCYHGFNSKVNSGLLTGRFSRLSTISWKRSFATTIRNRTATMSLRKAPISKNASIGGRYIYSHNFSTHQSRQNQNAATWIRQLEPYLPPNLRDETSKDDALVPYSSKTDTSVINASYEGEEIATIIRHARLSADLDLLAYLGFTLRRWPAVYALITKMLDATDDLQRTSNHTQGPLSNLKWESRDMKFITSASRSRKENPIVAGFETPSRLVSMKDLTGEPRNHAKTWGIMGEIWQSLGFIVSVAADKTVHESQLAMLYVYQTLARLHHSGLISDAIYKFSERPDYGSLFQPPGMHLLSSHIMNVLSDAVWLVHEAEVTAKAKAAGEESPYRPYKMGIRHLGHEIWLEFILWSCVEQGHVREGVWILKQLQGRKYRAAWKLISWSSLIDHLPLIYETDIDTQALWSHPDIQNAPEEVKDSGFFHGLGRRTISAEVVTALAINATNTMSSSDNLDSATIEDVTGLLTFLNTMKHEGKTSHLDPVCRQIVQVLESHNVKPKIESEWLEQVINALPPPLPPWDDSVPRDYQRLSALSKHEICSSSSMLTGLLQQDLRLYSRNRQIESAVKVFASLLENIDSSKMERIQEFLGKEKYLEKRSESSNEMISFPKTSVQIDQSSIPTLSNGTLADLLDLVTICKAFSFGEWLLFSNDVDGPVISFESFRDQSLTPSILRFAAATQNRELSNIIIQQLKPPISRNTFNALANCHMAFNQWEEAEEILNLLRHRRKAWGDSTVASLASAILRLEQKARETPQDKDVENSLMEAENLLRRLLLGYYNPMSSFDENIDLHYKRARYRWYELLSSIPGVLARTCSDVKLKYTNPLGRDTLPFIPSVAFNVLLNAIVETRGSLAGMEYWQKWCIDLERSHAPRLVEDGTYRLQNSTDPSTEDIPFDFDFDWSWFREKQSKAVIPNLNTLRIISRAAVKELREVEETIFSSSTSTSAANQLQQDNIHNVLDFCVERYRRFNQDESDIEREIDGHLTAMETVKANNQRSDGRKRLIQWVNMDVPQLENVESSMVKTEEYQG